MKNFLTILLAVFVVAVLVVGHSYWNKQIAASGNRVVSGVGSSSSGSSEGKGGLAGAGASADADKSAAGSAGTGTGDYGGPSAMDEELLALTKNWPDEAVEQFVEKVKADKKFTILFVGSAALGTEVEGVFPVVKEKLVKAFGTEHVSVALETYRNTTTKYIAAGRTADLADKGADLIVFEPFILTNNGLVAVEQTKGS
ncbi:hypothetical protein [Bacillus rubiinfantis]|uniref:hypothetical protein n=1 Tax=Bacillus rubiinfantis TaxID=1499680 RepID=UPI0005AA9B15|nr:hypothetical protein [Bacillus rubiinfantis]